MNLSFEISETLYEIRQAQARNRQRIAEIEREIKQQDVRIARILRVQEWLEPKQGAA